MRAQILLFVNYQGVTGFIAGEHGENLRACNTPSWTIPLKADSPRREMLLIPKRSVIFVLVGLETGSLNNNPRNPLGHWDA